MDGVFPIRVVVLHAGSGSATTRIAFHADLIKHSINDSLKRLDSFTIFITNLNMMLSYLSFVRLHIFLELYLLRLYSGLRVKL